MCHVFWAIYLSSGLLDMCRTTKNGRMVQVRLGFNQRSLGGGGVWWLYRGYIGLISGRYRGIYGMYIYICICIEGDIGFRVSQN